MSGGGGAAARKVIAWSDLVTLKGKGQRGVLVRRMPGDKFGVRRANGSMFEADIGALLPPRQHRRVGVGPRWPDRCRHGSLRGARPGSLRRRRTAAAAAGPAGRRRRRVAAIGGAPPRHGARPGRLRRVRAVARQGRRGVPRRGRGVRRRRPLQHRRRGGAKTGRRRSPSIRARPAEKRPADEQRLVPGAARRRHLAVCLPAGVPVEQRLLEAQSREGHRRRRACALGRLHAPRHQQGAYSGVGAAGMAAQPSETGTLPLSRVRSERLVRRRPLLLSRPS